MTNNWNIPKLAIDIEQAVDAKPRYKWSVVLIMPDADGTRALGYRRTGHLDRDLVSLTYDNVTAVHDADRDVWTGMNPTDRADVQKKIDQLVLSAAKKMVENGQTAFHHEIT